MPVIVRMTCFHFIKSSCSHVYTLFKHLTVWSCNINKQESQLSLTDHTSTGALRARDLE